MAAQPPEPGKDDAVQPPDLVAMFSDSGLTRRFAEAPPSGGGFYGEAGDLFRRHAPGSQVYRFRRWRQIAVISVALILIALLVIFLVNVI